MTSELRQPGLHVDSREPYGCIKWFLIQDLLFLSCCRKPRLGVS
jgi:hypothetical protein